MVFGQGDSVPFKAVGAGGAGTVNAKDVAGIEPTVLLNDTVAEPPILTTAVIKLVPCPLIILFPVPLITQE